MNILALDLSLTASGWALSDGHSGVYKPPQIATGIRRLIAIRDAMLGYATNADLVVIEGFAYGAKGRAILDIAGMGWLVRVALFERGYNVVEVPPASLKMFATGKGNADKNAMLGEAIRKLKYDGNDHNEADAKWLLFMAQTYYGGAAAATNAKQREALAKIQWPSFTQINDRVFPKSA